MKRSTTLTAAALASALALAGCGTDSPESATKFAVVDRGIEYRLRLVDHVGRHLVFRRRPSAALKDLGSSLDLVFDESPEDRVGTQHVV